MLELELRTSGGSMVAGSLRELVTRAQAASNGAAGGGGASLRFGGVGCAAITIEAVVFF
jgi:hypothetical protein